jgi:hypothetical protein
MSSIMPKAVFNNDDFLALEAEIEAHQARIERRAEPAPTHQDNDPADDAFVQAMRQEADKHTNGDDAAQPKRHAAGLAAMKQRIQDAANPPPSAADILHQAHHELNTRASTYDRPEGERSMGATVHAFNVITGHSLTEEQGWLLMAVLKAVRTQQGNYRADSYVDGAGYFALAGETAARDRRDPSDNRLG